MSTDIQGHARSEFHPGTETKSLGSQSNLFLQPLCFLTYGHSRDKNNIEITEARLLPCF